MINVEQQEKLFLAIGRELKKKIIVYAVGGTAMMFHGLKEATLDVDLVFENEKDRKVFRIASEVLGYKEFNNKIIYGEKNNAPQMLTLGKERLDLFLSKVIKFTFSENMKRRAKQTHEFGNNLLIKIADPHDLILMKCATDRVKDKDDVMRILKNAKINFDLVIEESQHQINLGSQTASFELGCFLEEIHRINNNLVPMEVLDKLFALVERQAEQHRK